MKQHRQAISVAILATGLLAGAVWCHGLRNQARKAAELASRDLVECERLAEQIERLRQRPALAGSKELQLTELARRIEGAAKDSQVPPGSIVRIWPQQARRLEDSVFKEKPTQVLLRSVGMPQLIRFLHKLATDGSGLHVKSIRLVAPRDQLADQRWTAEATLTYLVYAPKAQVNPVGTGG